MKWWESALHIVGIVFTYFAHVKVYSLIFKNNIRKFKIIDIFLVLSIILITYYNTFYNYGFSKIVISFLSIFLILEIVYKEDFKTTFSKSLIIYFIGFVIEMIVGGLAFYMFFDSVESFDKNITLKVLFSTINMVLMMLLSKIKSLQKLLNKLNEIMYKIFNMTLTIILFIIVLVLMTYYLIISTEVISYFSIVLIFIIISIMIFISMYQIFLTKKANDKQEILLNFMKEYEMIIDKERIDRHEMVNNLLVLKSIKNKNTKSYDKILDDILLMYQSNKTPKGLYELPSGLKGLFYYKIYDMKNNKIETFINISDKIIKNLDNLDSKTLTKVCKILGILLDNAKEAAKETKEKLVVIDLYKKKKYIIIYIENSIINNCKIDLNSMKVKGFSTKGSNRGYGLYLVDKLLNKTDKLELVQEINNNKFISVLKIKNN